MYIVYVSIVYYSITQKQWKWLWPFGQPRKLHSLHIVYCICQHCILQHHTKTMKIMMANFVNFTVCILYVYCNTILLYMSTLHTTASHKNNENDDCQPRKRHHLHIASHPFLPWLPQPSHPHRYLLEYFHLFYNQNFQILILLVSLSSLFSQIVTWQIWTWQIHSITRHGITGTIFEGKPALPLINYDCYLDKSYLPFR